MSSRAAAIVTGLAGIKPDPRAGANDVVLDAALQAAAGLQQLLQFRGEVATASGASEQQAATALLLSAGEELAKAAATVSGLLELARASHAAERGGTSDLN